MPPRRRTSATDRLQEQLSAGDAYGALQTARALYARLEGQGKGIEARDTILNVARLFAEKGEFQSVVDLAKLYMTNSTEKTGVVDATKPDIASSGHGYSRGGRDNILALATCLPPSSEKVSILSALAKWGMEELKQPDPQVCLELAEAHREVKHYAAAVNRLMQTGPEGALAYVGLLKEWMETGYRSEADLFVCRPIFLLLSRGDYPYGKALYQGIQADKELSEGLKESPLYHLIGILLNLIEARQPALQQRLQDAFRLVRRHYSKALARDPELVQAMVKIGEGYFGVYPPANPLASLLSSMLGGGMPQLGARK